MGDGIKKGLLPPLEHRTPLKVKINYKKNLESVGKQPSERMQAGASHLPACVKHKQV